MELVRDGEDSELVLELIGAAVIAGAYRRAAVEMPACRGGWAKMARRHSLRVEALAEQIAGATPFGVFAAPLPGTTRHTHGDTA